MKLCKQSTMTIHGRCWFLLLHFILFFYNFGLTFILPIINENVDAENNSTVSLIDEKIDIITSENNIDVVTSTENKLMEDYDRTVRSIIEDESFAFSTAYFLKENISTENDIYVFTTVPFIFDDTSTIHVINEEIATSPTITINRSDQSKLEDVNSTVMLSTNLLSVNTTISDTEYILESSYPIVVGDNILYNKETLEAIETTIDKPIKDCVDSEIYSILPTTSYNVENSSFNIVNLQPSIEEYAVEDSTVWYTVESLTGTSNLSTIYDTIIQTVSPQMESFPEKEISNSNFSHSEETTEWTRVWYFMDSDGIAKPYNGTMPDDEEISVSTTEIITDRTPIFINTMSTISSTTSNISTTTSPVISTTSPIFNAITETITEKPSYCFYVNDQFDSIKYCIKGCNCNCRRDDTFHNCLFMNCCRPTCYYIPQSNQSNISTKCFNIKSSGIIEEPICCHRQFQTNDHQIHNILPVDCYEFQFSYPLSTIYFKCK